jgi:site-specific recombinase XerD
MTTELLEKYKRWLEVERENNDKTVRMMVRFTNDFIGWLSNQGLSLDDINQEAINEYIGRCKKEYSQNSLVPITSNLRKFLVYFLKKEVNVKVARTVSPDRDKTPLTQDEVEALFKEASGDSLAEAILKTLYYSGIRRNELINLNINDIDFNRMQLIIRHGKGNRYRIVNITQDCAMALQRWIQARPKQKKGHENALFISVYGTRVSRTVITNAIRKYASQAKITKHIYPHKFRISMITHMAEKGCTVREIQAQSGHRKVSILVDYIQHSSDRIRKAYENVFEKNSIPDKPDIKVPMPEDTKYYKKKAFEKYLNGELDNKSLNDILSTFENKKHQEKNNKDVAYS